MSDAAERIKCMVSIVDRGSGIIIKDMCEKNNIRFCYICFGKGTASSELLDMLGIGSSEKDVVLSLVPEGRIPLVLSSVSRRMNMRNPGRGIAFAVSLSGINALAARLVTENGAEKPEYEALRKVDDFVKFSLVLAVYNAGYSEDIMEVAKQAGATGGTILNARGVSKEKNETFFGFPLQEEKEIVAILTPEDQKKEIMENINRKCGLKSAAQAVVLSMPVEDVAGL